MRLLAICLSLLVGVSAQAQGLPPPKVFVPQLPAGAPPVHIPGTPNIPQPGTYPNNVRNNLIYQQQYPSQYNRPYQGQYNTNPRYYGSVVDPDEDDE